MAEEKSVSRTAPSSPSAWEQDDDRATDELMSSLPSLGPLWTVCAAIILTMILVALHLA